MLLLVDLDGVVYRGSAPVPGVAAVLQRRAAAGDTIVYVTNNSRWHRSEYLPRLQQAGVPVTADRIVTAGRATALRLTELAPVVRSALVVGGPGLAREIEDLHIATVASTPEGIAHVPEAVVVGIDLDLSYARLSLAATVVRDGAHFLATNRDPVYPTETGLMAGAGSMVAAIEVAAGRPVDEVVGKPEPGLFLEAARLVGREVAEAVVIGDGLHSDIAAARRVGARSVLMLTGVTTREAAEAAPTDGAPTEIAQDAEVLERILTSFDDA